MVLGFKKQFVARILVGLKIHTIREDKHDRWHPGMKIHFATGVRTSYYNQFREGVCISTQYIRFRTDRQFRTAYKVYVDDMLISDPIKLLRLAENDGFGSIDDLYTFFKHDFVGKIIHWTNLKY